MTKHDQKSLRNPGPTVYPVRFMKCTLGAIGRSCTWNENICTHKNIFLNSFDVYSDTTLAFNTLTFNLGDSLLLSGCKVCYGKEDKDIFTVRKTDGHSCQHCVTANDWFQCGSSVDLLNNINDLQQSDKCNNESVGVNIPFVLFFVVYDFLL